MKIFKKENKKNLSDNELLIAYRTSGDVGLLGELFTRYTHLVYGVCLKYLRKREDARDAVMGIFEKLLTEIPEYQINKFSSWLYVISKNYCLMQLRSEKTVEKHKTIWLNTHQVFMDNDEVLHPIDEETAKNDMALKNCIERLKEEQRKCIELFYFKSKCYHEIAGELKIDEKKVKSHLQNGKRNLKICLENKDENEK